MLQVAVLSLLVCSMSSGCSQRSEQRVQQDDRTDGHARKLEPKPGHNTAKRYCGSLRTAVPSRPRVGCPDESEYVGIEFPCEHPARGTREYQLGSPFPQAETYCRRRDDPDVRHGPYVRWGPNREQLLAGDYRDGNKHGKWSRWVPTRTYHTVYASGREVSRRTTRNHGGTLDVGACVPHNYGFDVSMGAAWYRAWPEAGLCLVTWAVKTEGVPQRGGYCRFPQDIGLVKYTFSERGVEFDHAAAYCL